MDRKNTNAKLEESLTPIGVILEEIGSIKPELKSAFIISEMPMDDKTELILTLTKGKYVSTVMDMDEKIMKQLSGLFSAAVKDAAQVDLPDDMTPMQIIQKKLNETSKLVKNLGDEKDLENKFYISRFKDSYMLTLCNNKSQKSDMLDLTQSLSIQMNALYNA